MSDDDKKEGIFSMEANFPLIKGENVDGVRYEVRHCKEVPVSEEQTEKILTAEKEAVDLGKKIMGEDFLNRACGGDYVSVKVGMEGDVQGLMYNSLITRPVLLLMEMDSVKAAILHEFVEMYREEMIPNESGEGVQLFTEFLFCGQDREDSSFRPGSWQQGDPHTTGWEWVVDKLELKKSDDDQTWKNMVDLKRRSTPEEKVEMVKKIILMPERTGA
jgi:hypothetical protein